MSRGLVWRGEGALVFVNDNDHHHRDVTHLGLPAR